LSFILDNKPELAYLKLAWGKCNLVCVGYDDVCPAIHRIVQRQGQENHNQNLLARALKHVQ
jgi:hypothetical protein